MLSRQKQRQIIKALLDGEERSVDPEQVDDRFLRSCYETIRHVPAARRRHTLMAYLEGQYGNWKELYDSLNECPPVAERAFASYADLAPSLTPIDWFWEGWIPNRLLSALAAPPGAGKSMIALDLARRTAAGEPGPDGAPIRARSTNVIYVDAENVPQITLERARTWGMELGCLYPMLPVPYGIIDLNDVAERDHLIEMANVVRPGLIVIDSLSMVSNQGDTNVEEVRPILTFLTALAGDAHCAVLLIHHTRKRARNALPGREMTLDDVRGSGHIVATCRSILGLSVIQTGPRLDPNGPRKLQVLKTNLGVYPDPLGVQFIPQSPRGVQVRYGDAPQRFAPPTTIERCGEWLLATLAEANQPMRPCELIEAAQDAGFTRSIVYRARRQLGERIVDTAGHRNPDNKWDLASP